MNCGLEFHDSRVSSIRSVGDAVAIVFEGAYLHRSEGAPGSDHGTGWIQAGALHFACASMLAEADIGEGWIIDGFVEFDAAGELSLIPVPFDFSGTVAARFVFNNGCVVQVQAKGARLTLTGEARFVEAFPGR